MAKTQVNFRLTERCQLLIKALADHYSMARPEFTSRPCTQAQAVEMTVACEAERTLPELALARVEKLVKKSSKKT